MPPLTARKVAVTLDMAGCPNRCRHCWVGNGPNIRMSEETLRWVVKQFREYVHPTESTPFFDQMIVQTWYREPDFSSEYRRLWELEKELSDEGQAVRFELASIWRLARDEDYAKWLKEVKTKAVQVSFFGLEENTDYFTRRSGAFRDSLVATERLLAEGIYPRWQLFLTEKLVPELDEFVELVHSLDLDHRVATLGGEFCVFLNTPVPDGEGFHIEHLRPSADVLERIPEYLRSKTMKHFHASNIRDALGKTEAEWVKELKSSEEPYASIPSILAFMITPHLDVFTNLGETTPWWSLGNLQTDGIDMVLKRFETSSVPGLYGLFHVPIGQLAEKYGRPESMLLYAKSDLIRRWLRLWGKDSK